MSTEGYCPRTWRTQSIIALILFFPLGIMGLYYGRKTWKYYRHPDKYNMAVKASQRAGSCAIIGIIAGLIIWISFYFIFIH